jgi:sugar phosphate isomerase/epimerase
MDGPTVKLACMTWPYAAYSFERALAGIAQAGYRYVSFGLPHEGKPAFDDAADGEAARVVRLLERYGLEPVTLVSTDALAPGKPLELARRRLDFARDLGVDELLSLGTWGYVNFPDEPRPAEEMEALNETFAAKYRQIGEEAGKRGLVVTIKPHTGNTATASVMADTLRRIGSPHVKASYDPGNVRYYEGVDPAADFPLIAGDLVSLVAKDHRGARAESNFPVPGEGDVDFPALFAIMRAASFSGPVVVERLDGKSGNFGAGLSAEYTDVLVAQARNRLAVMLEDEGFTVR